MVIVMAKGITIDSFPLDLVHWRESIPSDIHHPNVPSIAHQTTLCVIEPTRPYLTKLFEQHKQKSWADIFPPSGFHEQSDRFFCQTILPGINARSILEKYEIALENFTLENKEFSPVEAETLLECFETLNSIEIELEKILANILRYRKA